MKYLVILMISCIVLLGLCWYHKKKLAVESFQQTGPFSLKTDADIYDDFYCDIYDRLMLPDARVKYELGIIMRTLNPDKNRSRILDVGAGTGTLVNSLVSAGYNAIGVDRSLAMKERGKTIHQFSFNNPHSGAEMNGLDRLLCASSTQKGVKKGDVGEPMLFDKGAFTIILCLDFTLYEIPDKIVFFKNCYSWLERGGYLVIHLAEKDQFNAIIPGAKPAVLDSIEQLGPERVKKTVIDFGGFVYTSDYVDGSNEYELIHKETFVDKASKNVRQNELTLYMEPSAKIIEMVSKVGFIPKGVVSMSDGPARDAAQNLVIFERGS